MSDQGKTLAALLIGAAAGAVLGVLFAPEKGEKTRKQLFKLASQAGDEFENGIEEGIDYAKRKVADGKEKVSRLGSQIHDKASEVASKAEDVKDKAKSELDEAKGRAKQQFT